MDFGGIPSPPAQWRSFNIGQWLREAGLEWFGLNLQLNAYAVFILLGIGAALWVSNRRLVARGAEPWVVLDVALWAVPLGILGGRLYHVITHPADYFYEGANLLRVFYVWEGGLAIFGAITLGAVGAFIGTRRSGLRFGAYVDALAPGLLIAQAVGRMGNYVNQELFGAPTALPWGLQIDRPNAAIPVGLPAETLFHPTFAYEMIWNLLGAAVLIWVGRRFALQWGRLLGLYLVWYGVGRAFLETLRLDPAELLLGIRVNIWGSLAAIALGVIILVVQGRRHPGSEPGAYRLCQEWVPEPGVHSEEDYFVVTDESSSGDDEGAEPPATSQPVRSPSS
jgi:prolipoprotein diacylglyceryl transferase